MDRVDPSSMAAPQIAQELMVIWKKALNLRDVGSDQTFLSLGGDSLDAMHILMGVEEQFGVELPNSALFDHPTIASLGAAVGDLLRAKTGRADATPTRRAA